jgi:hypothetical protein
VRQSARHTLFVEGDTDDGIDPEVLRHLLDDLPVQIKPLGYSSYLKAVAQAMYKHHPFYYFLIDRDHHEQKAVDESWQKFPHKDICNLLIWQKREIENYFLDPDYISKSTYLHCSYDKLKTRIRAEAQRRLFFDVANLVIVGLSESLKKNWIEVFKNGDIANFASEQEALLQLLNHPRLPQKKAHIDRALDKSNITQLFKQMLVSLSGGQEILQYGQGSWLEMISGKEVLSIIVGDCFRVRDQHQRVLQGNNARKEIIKELLSLPKDQQPADFQKLYRLLANQTRN